MRTSTSVGRIEVPRAGRPPIRTAVVAVAALLIGACSQTPTMRASAMPLPLTPVGELALPGNDSRFDYASLDSNRGLLFIAHLGASEVIEVASVTITARRPPAPRPVADPRPARPAGTPQLPDAGDPTPGWWEPRWSDTRGPTRLPCVFPDRRSMDT